MIANYTDFGFEVKHRLVDKRMTMKNLADQLGISYSYLNYMLRGARENKSYKEKIIEILEMETAVV